MPALPGQNKIQYGAEINQNLLRFIGPVRGTVVDLGCGAGGWADELRSAGAERLKGVEPSDDAAAAARRYDEVLHGAIESTSREFFADASLIVLADVLEHLTDPWTVLRHLREVAPPGTRLAISLPNLQNVRLLLPLLLRGRFAYSDVGGVMDRGHMRWFTESELRRAVEDAGWTVERTDGHHLGRVSNAAMRWSRGGAGPWIYHQLHLMARSG